jgi:hypothetical protein
MNKSRNFSLRKCVIKLITIKSNLAMKTALFTTFVVFGLAASVKAQTLSNYQALVTSQAPTVYFKLDGSLTNTMGGGIGLQPAGPTGGFMVDAFGNATNSYSFFSSGDSLTNATDLIPGGGDTNAAATGVGSISILFRALPVVTSGQRYIFYQGNVSGNGNALSLYFDSDTATSDQCALKLRVGNGTTTLMLSNNIAFSGWYYFAMTYDEARDAGEVLWYLGRLGGTLNSGTINLGSDAVIGDNGPVIIGNQTNLTSGFRESTGKRGRIDEVAIWNRELNGTEITNQFTALPQLLLVNNTYEQTISAQLPAHYFKFNGSIQDSVVTSLTLNTNGTTGSFVTNVLGMTGSAYSFNETNDALFTSDILSGGGAFAGDSTAAAVGTISLTFRALDDVTTGQRYIFAQGTIAGNGTNNALTLFFDSTTATTDPAALKLRVGNGPTTTLLTSNQIAFSSWYYFAMTYDEARNSSPGEIKWYIGPVGGTLTPGLIDIGNTSVVGDNTDFVIGNRGGLTNAFRNPGAGVIDDVAIWNDELPLDQITAQFNSITNAVVSGPAPLLTITSSGSDVLISWPTTTAPAYALESATNLTTSPWVSAGTPSVVGPNNVVTNATSGAQKYFRLHKP